MLFRSKLTHGSSDSLVDYNRAGTPLMEIVSDPAMHTPEEAYAYLTSLRATMIYGGISDCDMEKGQLRCDANISLRPVGQKTLGTKVELKNLNSISFVRDGIAHEIRRQIALLERGGVITQETRDYDGMAGTSQSLRSKEEAHDYRYFPDPDLMPVAVAEAATAAKATTAAKAAAALVALTVAIDLAHHRGRTFLQLFDAHGEIADDVFVDALLTLDFGERGCRRIDVEKREVRLAVLLDAEVQRLHAPVLVLGDLATEPLDDRRELLGQVFDLLRADVLARKIDVLIIRHEMPSSVGSSLGAKPFEPFGKARLL